MGSVEIIVVLLVAFIVLGPKRMTEAARMLGKATREVRRMTEGLPQMIMDEEEPSQVPEWRRTVAGASRQSAPDDIGAPADGPVAFRSGAEPKLPSGPGEQSGSEEPGPAAPADGGVVFEGGAGPASSVPTSEENGGDEPELVAPPERDTK